MKRKYFLLLSFFILFAGTSIVGTMWKQVDTTVSPADDVTDVDLSGVTVAGVASSTAFANHTGDTGAHGGSSIPDRVLLKDRKTLGTEGGTCTSGAWQLRNINFEDVDTGGFAHFSSNGQVILEVAGTWEGEMSAPAFAVNEHQARWYSFTNATAIAYGTSQYAQLAGNGYNRSLIETQFTSTADEVFGVQHRCTTTLANQGFGLEANFGPEVYTIIDLTKR